MHVNKVIPSIYKFNSKVSFFKTELYLKDSSSSIILEDVGFGWAVTGLLNAVLSLFGLILIFASGATDSDFLSTSLFSNESLLSFPSIFTPNEYLN